MKILVNPSQDEIAAVIASSRLEAARRIVDKSTGNTYVWDAAEGTHLEGAKAIGIEYSVPAGMGEILTLNGETP